jgi:hypothetical protein
MRNQIKLSRSIYAERNESCRFFLNNKHSFLICWNCSGWTGLGSLTPWGEGEGGVGEGGAKFPTIGRVERGTLSLVN